MLMQNFKSAADLGITEPQLSALQKTLVLLETGRLVHVPMSDVRPDHTSMRDQNIHFNMIVSYGRADCGSVGCIRGTAERVCAAKFGVFDLPDALHDLFYNGRAIISDATTAQAATALRSYLTTGDARWDLAVA